MKRCPYCAEVIKDKAIVCRFCDRDIPAIAADELPFPESPASVGNKLGPPGSVPAASPPSGGRPRISVRGESRRQSPSTGEDCTYRSRVH